MADDEPHGRELTFGELAARAKAEATADEAPELPREAGPNARDDELLIELPRSDHHLGRFAGWQAGRKLRWIVGGTLGVAVLAGVIVFVQHNSELRQRELHPLPEVEALLSPGTPREMTLSDGQMRVALSREAPAINLLHLPDRDITLARGCNKAQFKVEIRDGKTVRIKVLTGEIVETLTRPDAEPLVSQD